MKKKLRIKKFPDGGTFKPIKGTKEQYQAYQDSLTLYNTSQKNLNALNSSATRQDWLNYYRYYTNSPEGSNAVSAYNRLKAPVPQTINTVNGSVGLFKKPVQPIIYQPQDEDFQKVIQDGNNRAGMHFKLETRQKQNIENIQPRQLEQLQIQPINQELQKVPFSDYFSRERQNQETDSKQFGRKGKTDYFDKTTGKLLGTFENGEYLNMKKKIKKYAEGGWGGQWNNSTTPTYTSAPPVNNQWTNASYLPSNMQEDTTNLFGSSPSSTNTGKGFSASQASGYAGAAAGILRNIAPGATGYQSQSAGAKGLDSVKEIGKQIPFVGGFVQAGDASADLLQSGINDAEKKGNKAGAEAAAWAQGFLDPIGEQSKTVDLWKKKKLSTGQAVGHTILNFMGLNGISSAIYQKKFAKDLNPKLYPDKEPLQKELTLNPQVAQMAKGGMYNGGPVQLETNETLLRQLPNGGTQLERFNLPTHEQSGEKPNTYMNKPDYAASPNLGYNKAGQITLNPKEVKMTFADKTKKVENRFKRNHVDPIADKTKEMALNQIKQDNELLKSALEQAQTSKMMYGGSIPKGANGLKWSDLGMQDKIAYARSKQALDSKADDFTYIEAVKRGDLDSMFQNIDFTNTFGPITSKPAPLINSKPINNTFNNTKYNTSKVTPTKFIDEPVTEKSKLGLTAGDYIQLAGTLPALGYNLARSFEKPEVERFGRDLTPIREQVLAKDYNPLIMAQNAGMATLNDSTNAATRNANLISLISNVAGEKAKYSLATDAQNAGLARQRDQLLSGQRQYNIGVGINEKTVNAQNREFIKGFGAKAASQFGQSLTEVGKSMNKNQSNNIKLNALESLVGSFTVNPDGSYTFKKKKGGYYGRK